VPPAPGPELALLPLPDVTSDASPSKLKLEAVTFMCAQTAEAFRNVMFPLVTVICPPSIKALFHSVMASAKAKSIAQSAALHLRLPATSSRSPVM
jgi:hypothetical protein